MAGVVLSLAATSSELQLKSADTVKVCHGPEGVWGKVLEVKLNQVPRHLGHGDYVVGTMFPEENPATGDRCRGYFQ